MNLNKFPQYRVSNIILISADRFGCESVKPIGVYAKKITPGPMREGLIRFCVISL